MYKEHTKVSKEDMSGSGSDDSSHRSDNCDCEPRCKKNKCVKACKCNLTPEEVVCKFKDAVVEVHAEFVLVGSAGFAALGSPVNKKNMAGLAIAPDTRADVIMEGNGFFIKGHYIICPSHLVLLPPALTSVARVYPCDDFSTTATGPSGATCGVMENRMVRASRILVSVFNVNGDCRSYAYEADLVGVDGAGDIAVLVINPKKTWNSCNPCIEKCHPYFSFGKSRASKNGEIVYLLGDYVTSTCVRKFNGVGCISAGLLSDHRYVDYTGNSLPELVLVSAPAYAYSAGLPILNCNGQVIGMQTCDVAGVSDATISPLQLLGNTTTGSGFVAGPSQFFMCRVIRTLIKGLKCNGRRTKLDCHLHQKDDGIGSYLKYVKAYAGLAYNIATTVDYDVTRDYSSSNFPSDHTYAPQVRIDANGNFLNTPTCKELMGIRVVGIAGSSPNGLQDVADGFFFVPGGGVSGTVTMTVPGYNPFIFCSGGTTAATGCSPLASGLAVSPFLGKLNCGDIITHIESCALGNLTKQIAPSLITWRLCANAKVEICYRSGGYTGADGNPSGESYEFFQNRYVNLGEFPELMDYPYSAINSFPSLVDGFGWSFPRFQTQLPQVPSLSVTAGTLGYCEYIGAPIDVGLGIFKAAF